MNAAIFWDIALSSLYVTNIQEEHQFTYGLHAATSQKITTFTTIKLAGEQQNMQVYE
jgi:hypothetical protein